MNLPPRKLILIGLIIAAACSTAVAELIPVPEFADHPIPTASVPDGDGGWWETLDVLLLGLALVLASYFALIDRSRRKLLALTIGCLIWFGFVRQGCVCPIGAVQNVALAFGDTSYIVPLGVIAFFSLPLIFTLFFGRTFCASVCPLGAMQELVAIRSIRVPRWLDEALGLIAYFYLGAAVIFAFSETAFLICRYDPFVGFFRLGGNANMMIFGGCLLLIGLFVGRPYCRYLCPYGAVLRVLSRFSKWHVRIPPTDCINCRLCEDACPYGAIQPPTVTQDAEHRRLGKRRLGWLLLAAPLLVAAMAGLGTWWSMPLSKLHPTVQLAEQVRQEELGATEATTDASDAFRNTGRSASDLYEEALDIRLTFRHHGGLLGAWIGLVLAVKLLHLSIRRQRVDYHPDQSGCVSCGRCFLSCPVEQVRLGLIEDVSEVVPETNT
jgi:ferredoxin